MIVFPRDSKGQVAAAEGVLEAREMSREQWIGWLAHLAEERGETFDAEKAEIGDGPFRLLQLQATGAELSREPLIRPSLALGSESGSDLRSNPSRGWGGRPIGSPRRPPSWRLPVPSCRSRYAARVGAIGVGS